MNTAFSNAAFSNAPVPDAAPQHTAPTSSEPRDPLIELESVSVTYRNHAEPALKDVSLSVSSGEIVLVAGASGCGKSTLLRVINGLVPRSYRAEVTGSVSIAGLDAANLSIRALSETVGTLLQDPAKQVVGTTGLAELAFGLENRGVQPQEIRSQAEHVASVLGIERLLDQAPHDLSGGQLQMLAFAGILILEPSLMIIDEPLANLDPDAADRLLSVVREYVDRGGAALVVEHRVDEALVLRPDRVLYLEQGQSQYYGDVAGFLRQADPSAVKLPFSALLDVNAFTTKGEDEDSARENPSAQESSEHTCNTEFTSNTELTSEADLQTARIIFDGVHLSYGDHQVIRHLDRSFWPGERIAILGPNGAGKSTLMRAAVGLLEPSQGTVLLEGTSVGELDAKELVGLCGYLFQNPAQALFCETVGAELAFGPRNLGADQQHIDAISAEALRAVDLDCVPNILERPPRTLSFGQQRRLAVALALTLRPRTLILDEPTAGQDQRSAAHFLDAVCAIPSIDSIYFITHDVDMALSRADRILVVSDGGVLVDTTPAQLVADRSLWHQRTQETTSGSVLRESDYVRAVRRFAPERGRLPDALQLARWIRAQLPHPGSDDASFPTLSSSSHLSSSPLLEKELLT